MRVAVPLLAALLCSCGSLMQPGPDEIPISSEPQGASIYLADQPHPVGVTPATIPISRGIVGVGRLTIRLEHADCHPQEIRIDSTVNGWVFGNLLFVPLGTVLALMIDGATYSITKWPEQPMHVVLTPRDQAAPVALRFPGFGTSQPFPSEAALAAKSKHNYDDPYRVDR